MITELLLIATAGILDPMDMSGNTMYRSGVKECDKYPRFPYPESKLAVLTLPREILSSTGEVIKSGHYLISLSISRQEVLLFEGHTLLYTLNVSQIETLEKNLKISTAEFHSSDNKEDYIILKQGKYVVKVDVELNE